MKVVLAGGGTGGHVYPALAMGDALKARGHEVIYVGAPDRLEARVAPEKGYEFPVRKGVAVSGVVASLGEFKSDHINIEILGKNNAEAVRIFDRVGWR